MQYKNGLKELFIRDLGILQKEIRAFANEDLIWERSGNISNSPGHLCYHLCGNLRHYIGHVLGENEYVRNREYEFTGTRVSREELFAIIEETKNELAEAFSLISDIKMGADFPVLIQDRIIRTETFLIHLYGHFNYHLGQINYFRRL